MGAFDDHVEEPDLGEDERQARLAEALDAISRQFGAPPPSPEKQEENRVVKERMDEWVADYPNPLGATREERVAVTADEDWPHTPEGRERFQRHQQWQRSLFRKRAEVVVQVRAEAAYTKTPSPRPPVRPLVVRARPRERRPSTRRLTRAGPGGAPARDDEDYERPANAGGAGRQLRRRVSVKVSPSATRMRPAVAGLI